MRVSLLTSWDERCGIADYSRHLVAALRDRVEVEIVPAGFRRCSRAVYAGMGRALSQGTVAHVQHSYAFFGGMHPLRCGWRSLAEEVRRPLVVTVHELDLRPSGRHGVPAGWEAAWKRRFNRSVFLHPRVRRWVVHAAALREALAELGAPEERILCRPLPIPPAPPLPDPEPLRRRLGLRGRRALVILGFLARRKGYDLALEALRALPEEFVLVAAGGEHAADRTGTAAWLRERARALGVEERLRVTGFLPEPDLEQAAALAEVVLAPFREMSASASLGFALARGRPVIASDLPENRALGCVHLFRTGDSAALAVAIREVADSPARKAELGRAAAAYAAANSFQTFAAETLALYEELAAEAATVPPG